MLIYSKLKPVEQFCWIFYITIMLVRHVMTNGKTVLWTWNVRWCFRSKFWSFVTFRLQRGLQHVKFDRLNKNGRTLGSSMWFLASCYNEERYCHINMYVHICINWQTNWNNALWCCLSVRYESERSIGRKCLVLANNEFNLSNRNTLSIVRIH